MIPIACSTGIRSSRSLEDACQVIHDLDFRYVDPLAIEGWHIKPSRLLDDPERETEATRRLFERYSLECVAINLGFVANFTACTDEEHRTNLKVLEGACVLAEGLDTSILTVGPGGTQDEDRDAVVKRLAERLKSAVDLAGGKGMTLGVETHAGAVVAQPDAARELLERCPGLTLTYDPSHYIAEQIPVEETLDLIANSSHMHLRNARVGHFQETMTKGKLDIPWMIDRILASDYEGAISIEYIEDCGALAEGYETKDEVVALRDMLVGKGLELR